MPIFPSISAINCWVSSKRLTVFGIGDELHFHLVALFRGGASVTFTDAIAIAVRPAGLLQQGLGGLRVKLGTRNITDIGRAEELRPDGMRQAVEDLVVDRIHIHCHADRLTHAHIRKDGMRRRSRVGRRLLRLHS